MLKIAKKIKNIQTMQNNQDISINGRHLKDKMVPIKHLENSQAKQIFSEHLKQKTSKNNENYLQSLIHMIRETYPKNFDSPQYKSETLAGKQRLSFENIKQNQLYLKVKVNQQKNSLKKVPTVSKFCKYQTKATSTSDLLNKNWCLKSILKKDFKNVKVADDKEIYQPFKNVFHSKNSKELCLYRNKKVFQKSTDDEAVLNEFSKNISSCEKNKVAKERKTCKRKPKSKSKQNESDVLIENLRKAVIHSINILLSTPSLLVIICYFIQLKKI